MSATTIRPPKGWTAAEVHICVRGLSAENPFEMKPVDGYVCDAAPGLAITPTRDNPKEFNVTHIGSGFLVAAGFETRAKAARFVTEVAPLANWTWTRRSLERASKKEPMLSRLTEIRQRYL